ncbi:MAG: phosphoribosylpyrophosphate synthetase [Deltaproteobacteria bacterium GWA2_38_16]|nr:MAG: phosphoribosylpyrophosphate synthetase [Deltaproteobacteria bacterium GWA2_38_16]OGQ02867.1 MAG: phosphoribosylpyrophosphate synthetase [Deltaproteobacteria bacterium RIFCSPHIGHO2_02_FULL_38_15]OGQ35114.1 MAG: phosphoribosylpyrophosphate synthetase [Deltaproteobacteria bacterium RIFCSPLOWO2_01_FULL_38_9]OGQ61684.1 MAG: phosphoribosylpyrophosphate synthetase [Deltaproteobacteria bacterium RIFCSPLOWO2_12_FULL_38_8]HBQ21713.1 phosphoribosylpyrophosphate synthetase [Deltaproteobacteria bact
MSTKELKIFSGNSNPALSQEISHYLEIPLGKCEVKCFSDGEIFVQIEESVRGHEVFVIQSTCPPVNSNLMELLIMIDALKRASASSITAVIPYYGYARQDRKVAPRTPISSKLVADLLTASGASRVISMDLHAGQIQGFFNIPFDHLYSSPVMINHLREKLGEGDHLVIVSSDTGGVERARAYAKRLNASLAIVDKRRLGPNQAKAMNLIGEVQGKTTVIVDDMIDTAGTLTEAGLLLLDKGAAHVFACATHAVFSGPAYERLVKVGFEEIIVSNSIPLKDEFRTNKKIKVLSVAPLLGEAIKRVHNQDSVSSLFI